MISGKKPTPKEVVEAAKVLINQINSQTGYEWQHAKYSIRAHEPEISYWKAKGFNASSSSSVRVRPASSTNESRVSLPARNNLALSGPKTSS